MKVRGIYQPTQAEISIRRDVSGVTLSGSQLRALFNGEEIPFEAVNKSGKNYSCKLRIAELSFMSDDGELIKYMGIDRVFEDEVISLNDIKD